MILSASRRSDIPAFYSDWFLRRIEEGFLYVRNPFCATQLRRIDLSPQLIDCIVFWTKNPQPMLEQLAKWKEYRYYFHFTLNSYRSDIERNLPKKSELIETFRRLSDTIGKEKVIWRYDPIFLNDRYTEYYHMKWFERFCEKLAGYTNKCIFSYLDFYRKILPAMNKMGIVPISVEKKMEIAEKLSKIAGQYGLQLESCAEDLNLEPLGISRGKCIDPILIDFIGGKNLKKEKANQRKDCGCCRSIDIGSYDTCLHDCCYCYANGSSEIIRRKTALFQIDQSLLCDFIRENDDLSSSNQKKYPEQFLLFEEK